MAKPTQLALGDLELPFTSHDRYSASKQELGSELRTIGGRMVTELRGFYWKISYSYDYLGNDVTRQILKKIRSSSTISCTFLPDDSEDYVTADFKCTSYTPPTVAFSYDGTAMWHNLAFVLESVKAVSEE